MSDYNAWYESIQAIKLEPSKIDQSPIRKYTITINFKAERELTTAELEDLESAILAQVEEPVNWEGEDMEYSTSDISINTTKEDI